MVKKSLIFLREEEKLIKFFREGLRNISKNAHYES